MKRRPDIIRTIAVIFAIGLVITGFTSLQSTDDGLSPAASALVSEAPLRSAADR
jgi:hypothetical protein